MAYAKKQELVDALIMAIDELASLRQPAIDLEEVDEVTEEFIKKYKDIFRILVKEDDMWPMWFQHASKKIREVVEE